MTILLIILFIAAVAGSMSGPLRSAASTTTERFVISASRYHEACDTLARHGIERKYDFDVNGDYVFDVDNDKAELAAELLGLVRR